MPFDSFDSFSLLDSSFDSFASIYAFTENAGMRAEAERLEREIQQQNERHERVMFFIEWYVCKHINLNGSTNDFERQLSEVMPQYNMFLDEIVGKLFEMECPGCGLVIKAPTKKEPSDARIAIGFSISMQESHSPMHQRTGQKIPLPEFPHLNASPP